VFFGLSINLWQKDFDMDQENNNVPKPKLIAFDLGKFIGLFLKMINSDLINFGHYFLILLVPDM
jgi:hypothetical protein